MLSRSVSVNEVLCRFQPKSLTTSILPLSSFFFIAPFKRESFSMASLQLLLVCLILPLKSYSNESVQSLDGVSTGAILYPLLSRKSASALASCGFIFQFVFQYFLSPYHKISKTLFVPQCYRMSGHLSWNLCGQMN